MQFESALCDATRLKWQKGWLLAIMLGRVGNGLSVHSPRLP